MDWRWTRIRREDGDGGRLVVLTGSRLNTQGGRSKFGLARKNERRRLTELDPFVDSMVDVLRCFFGSCFVGREED